MKHKLDLPTQTSGAVLDRPGKDLGLVVWFGKPSQILLENVRNFPENVFTNDSNRINRIIKISSSILSIYPCFLRIA